MTARRTCILVVTLLFGACGPTDLHTSDGGVDGDAGAGGDGGGAIMSCMPNQPDLTSCGCTTPNAVRACYPANLDQTTRGKGMCRDGQQTCIASGEFSGWGRCMGAVGPATEICGDNLDNNCDGRIDCADPACATSASCRSGCTDGQTRPCYDGPSGTAGIGICRQGMQTCTGGMWPTTCPGEVTPSPENCADTMDHNCNGLPGCLDIFACLFAQNCQEQCRPDPGCVCPTGSVADDTAMCPDGMLGRETGGGIDNGGFVECCPCTANDCGNSGCCGERVCAGNPSCSGLTCRPLPASCNGQVSFDCDDFPEDCDQPCCKCRNCPP
jgi:hypothetical protein